MAQIPPQEVIDARYRAKLEARATGKAPVMVDAPKDASGVDLNARVRDKLARHAQAKPEASAPKPEEEQAKSDAPAAQSEDRRDGQQQRHEQRHKHR